MAEQTAARSFLDGLDEMPVERGELLPAPAAVVAKRRPAEERQIERLKAIEDKILEDSAGIMQAALRGGDVDDGQKEIPDEWIATLGLKGAARALRIAQDARQSPKMHPVYLDLAKSVYVGITRARATQPNHGVSLNVSFTLAAPRAAYAIIDLEIDEK